MGSFSADDNVCDKLLLGGLLLGGLVGVQVQPVEHRQGLLGVPVLGKGHCKAAYVWSGAWQVGLGLVWCSGRVVGWGKLVCAKQYYVVETQVVAKNKRSP